jgi:hypothetical protein
MNISFCIKTCNKFKDTRLRTCFDTWAKGLNDVYANGDATELDVLEGHDNLTKKLRRYFLCNMFTPGNWLFIGDDDTYVNVAALQKFADEQDPWIGRSFGRGIMPTRQACRYTNAAKIQPKLSCNQTNSGVLMSPPMVQAVQMICWMRRDPDHILVDDQWLSATVNEAKHLSGTHFGKSTFREISKPEVFLSKTTKRGDELISTGQAASLCCENSDRMVRVHELWLENEKIQAKSIEQNKIGGFTDDVSLCVINETTI